MSGETLLQHLSTSYHFLYTMCLPLCYPPLLFACAGIVSLNNPLSTLSVFTAIISEKCCWFGRYPLDWLASLSHPQPRPCPPLLCQPVSQPVPHHSTQEGRKKPSLLGGYGVVYASHSGPSLQFPVAAAAAATHQKSSLSTTGCSVRWER